MFGSWLPMEAEEIEMGSTNKKAIREYGRVLDEVSSGRASSGICDVLSVNSKTGKKQLLKAIVTKGWVAQVLEISKRGPRRSPSPKQALSPLVASLLRLRVR